MRDFLLFRMNERSYALPLETVHRAVRMVDVTPLPDAPPDIAGVVNYHGKIVPVFDSRHRCGLPNRPFLPSDHLLLAQTGERMIALPVDAAEQVFSLPAEDLVSMERVVPGLGCVKEAATLDGDIFLIYDLGSFLAGIELPDELGADDTAS